MLRARILVSMERLFTPFDREIPDIFPRHYYVLVPLGDAHMNSLSSNDQWNGVLNALKSEGRSHHSEVIKKVTKVEENLDYHVKRLEEDMKHLDSKLSRIIAQQEEIVEVAGRKRRNSVLGRTTSSDEMMF